MPVLAQYKPRTEYVPCYGDYFIWSKWFSTWHGLVVNYDRETGEVFVLMAGIPYLLFTMAEAEYDRETIKLKLSEIKQARNGKYAIQHHDQAQNAIIWYI